MELVKYWTHFDLTPDGGQKPECDACVPVYLAEHVDAVVSELKASYMLTQPTPHTNRRAGTHEGWT